MPIDIVHGTGYRIGESNRILGDPSADPEGFTVLNQQNNKLFIIAVGIWTDGGTFPNANFTQIQYDTWILS
jgi:hypothetical protein